MVLRLRNPKSLCLIVCIFLFTMVASARGQQQIEYSAEVAFPNLAFNQPDGIIADQRIIASYLSLNKQAQSKSLT